jgi:hypothetical protein
MMPRADSGGTMPRAVRLRQQLIAELLEAQDRG